MRRQRLKRAFAAILLLWFACITGAPAALHVCAVHDGAPGSAAAPGAEHTVGHARGAHDGHARDTHRQRGSDGGGEHAGCTCVGDCSAAGVVPALPAARPALAAGEVEPGASLPGYASPARVSPAFFLPYANGPPGPALVA